ncbi:MAG: serine/threonine-protein kinase, partial [Polyangiales bacterium]
VALKLVHLGSSLAQADAQERLLREAQGLARLDHPNVVTVFEAGTHGREVFIAMELVDGVSLDRWLAERPRDWKTVAAMLEQAGRGLAAAHAAGLVHRDIKPANVMIATDGRVKVVDFGLARALIELGPEPGVNPDEDLHARLTLSGALVGTPAYCAPEQLVGEQVDIRSDVFSFCVTLCEAAFGQRPFTATTAGGLIRRMKNPRGPDLPTTRVLPKRLLALIRRGLAIDPADRLPTLAPLLDELAHRPRRVAPALIAGGFAIAVAVPLVMVGMRSDADVCGGSRDELASTWSFARRMQVGHAILGTQVPFAADTWQRVEHTLDGYATQWTGMHGEACRATAVHHTQSDELLDRRMACLAGVRSQLDASIATLSEIDLPRVRSALRVVEGLPTIDACAAAATLLAVAPVPAGRGVEAEKIRTAIAQASAIYRAGAYTQAKDLAGRVATDAERFGYRPLTASAFHTLARVEDQLQMKAQARADFERAIDEAAASGDAEREASALADLSELVRNESADGQLANTLARHAVAIVERIHGAPALAAKVRLANARSMFSLDNVAAAKQLHLGLAELARAEAAAPDANHELRITYDLVGVNLLEQSERVKPELLRILAESERFFGANHPNLVVVLNQLVDNASIWELTGEARAYAERIAKIMAPYPGHESVLRRLDAELEPDPAKRRPILEQVVRDAETLYGPFSPQVASALDDLATNLDEIGEQDAAKPIIERAIQIWEGAYGSRYELLVTAYETKVTIYQRSDLATAAAAAERAVLLSNQPGVREVTKLATKITLGELYFRQGRFADTLKIMAEFRPKLGMLMEPGNPLYMTLDFVEAACNYELGHDKPAQLRRARDLYTKYRALRGADDPQTVRDQAAWLAGKS